MKIAVPSAQSQLCPHFGHCDEFEVFEVNADKTVTGKTVLPAPPHQPGLLPGWLAERGVNMVIAGGMGGRAQQLFLEQGVQVVVGAPVKAPAEVVSDYLAGKLITGSNMCDH